MVQKKSLRCWQKTICMIFRWTHRLPPLRKLAGWEASRLPRTLAAFFFLSHLISTAYAAVPVFYENNRMAALHIPEDTEVNSIIYRLRAKDTDRDYPLMFKIDAIGKSLVYLNPHNCSRSSNILCEADVYLGRQVEERVYNFDLTVSDTTGARTVVRARILGTKGRVTPVSDIFIKYSPAIRVKEDRPPQTVISTMIVRKKGGSPFGELHTLGDDSRLFKVMPGNLVSSNTINASILLENKLDYDTSNLHLFQVCQLHPFTDEEADTRNIACVSIAVIVEDIQDLPPMFTLAPPVTRVPSVAVRGDEVARVEAHDKDKGHPREIRYSILPASSLYTHYFRIDDRTGVLTMNESAATIRDKMVSLEPILMTVTAEEVTNYADNYPALATSVEIAFVVLDAEILIPRFVHEKYVGEIYEDSLPDTVVYLNSPFLVQGVKGLFSLQLEGDNGVFTVQPGVVKDASDITIKVKNSFLLDYETRPQIVFKLVARQVQGPQQVSGSAEITVRVLDTNDNIPKFSQPQYVAEIFENATRGTTIARVYATDDDSGPFGVVRYTSIYGPLSDRLYLDQTSGLITCATDNHGFDREAASEYVLTVEAKDNNGQGASANVATTKVIIRLKDVNDSRPKFEDSIYKGVLAPGLQRLREPIQIRAYDKDAERPNNEIEYDLERTKYSEYFYIEKISGRLDMKQNFAPRTLALTSNSVEKEVVSRKRRQLVDESDSVINLRVRATDRGYPPLSESVDVKIFKQELGERVFTFIYPRSVDEVIGNKANIEATLNEITGGKSSIKDVKQRRTGYLGTSIDPDRSEVTALVQFGVSTIVNLERVLSNMNNSQVHQLKTQKIESERVIEEISGENHSYLVGVVFLCIILAVIIIIIILCCFCEGCALYKDKKKYNTVGDDGSEGVSYIRVDENGKYRRNPEGDGPGWWDAMPNFMKNIFLMCGFVPSDRNNSRLAWSADERQRYWRMNQPPDAGIVDERSMMRAPRNTRDTVLVEDLDDSRSQRDRLQQRPGPISRVESRMSQNSQEPRRVFVLKDPRGVVPKGRESMREGEMYLIEDIDENAQSMRIDEARTGNIMVHQEEDYPYTRQGNAEALRLHASPRDAAYFRGQVRRVRRAGMESEGTVSLQDDPGGGLSSRIIEGQSTGPTPRSMKEHFVDDRRIYDPRYSQAMSPTQSDAYIQTEDGRGENFASRKRIKSPILEETRSLLDAERKSFRDKNKAKKSLRSEVQRYIDRSNEHHDQRGKSSKSQRSANIPGTYGYQHTKTSILRYESNKAKLEEEREELIRQGKDPDMCHVHAGGGGAAGVAGGAGGGESQRASVSSKLEGRRSHSQNTLTAENTVGLERRGSLPDIETSLELEAARRIQIRRNSAGGYEQYDDMPNEYQEVLVHQTPNRQRVIYINEADRSEELERRRQHRRNEASVALSEDLQRVSIEGNHFVTEDGRIVRGRLAEVDVIEVPPPTAVVHGTPSDIAAVHSNSILMHPVDSNSNNNSYVPIVGNASSVNSNNAVASVIGSTHADYSTGVANVITTSSSQNSNKQIISAQKHQVDSLTPNVAETAHASRVASNDTEYSTNTLMVESNNEIISASQNNNGIDRINDNLIVNTTVINNQETIANAVIANNILQTNHAGGRSTDDANLPDDAKSAQSINPTNEVTEDAEALRIMESEMHLGLTQSSRIFEKNARNDKSVLNIPSDKRKRSRMLEKKSVFTIAYDGMKTDQLRPESAAAEP